MIHENILSTVGNTPLVRIRRMAPEGGAEILAKLELFNPGGSVKDRIALGMLEAAEAAGELSEGDVIVEPTSGNTGVGLAMVAAVKGYRAKLVMPETMSRERRALLRHFGAELVLTPGGEGMGGAVHEAERLAALPGHFMPMQFRNPANPESHRRTAAEIVEALGGRKLDCFVAGVGTGGTVTGAGRALRETYPDLRVVAVEPSNSPVLTGGRPGPHKIQGLGAGFVPDIYDPDVPDQVVTVSDEDAIRTARELAKKEGMLVGISCGAAMFVAMEEARRLDDGALVVVVMPDTGERYISTELFEVDK
mgnify:CR=1 FL=1